MYREAVDLLSSPKVAVSSGTLRQLQREAKWLAEVGFDACPDQARGEWYLYIPAQEKERYREWARSRDR
jgi:hypothetical protein